MLSTDLWKWMNRNDELLKALQKGEYSEWQLQLLCRQFEEWVIEAQSEGFPYVEIGVQDLPDVVAINFIKFIEETQKMQGFLARTEERRMTYILISGWYRNHQLPKFDGRIYRFKTPQALEKKLPDFAKQRETDQIYCETFENFERYSYQKFLYEFV